MAFIDPPPELLYTICSIIHDFAVPAPNSSLDPLFLADAPVPPTDLPASYPPTNWPEPVARRTLASLCQVNRAWYDAAKPWLWRKVEVRLPHSWLALVDEVAGGDEEELDAPLLIDQTLQHATHAALAPCDAATLQASILASLAGDPDGSVPPELLSPPASREPSPARLRARTVSPGRWRLIRTVNNAVQNVLERNSPGVYVPLPRDTHPGMHVRHIDFNHFRTIGMRRLVGEGISKRFVTQQRLLRVLKEMPNLSTFGATEYMDGALTTEVLTELLFRGLSDIRGRSSRGRGVVEEQLDEEQDDWERRNECKPLEALDLCGCVSAVFVNALDDLVAAHLSPSGNRATPAAVRARDPVIFPGLLRLGLRGLTSVAPRVIGALALACPSLTHLDLSGTRCAPDLLHALGASALKLQALALGRCVRLTSESITSFLVEGTASHHLQQLSLYGDATFPSALKEADLLRIVAEAPCFRSGRLEYLDLSSAPLTPAVLAAFEPQPALRSLGLSHIMDLPLAQIAEFLRSRAAAVEVVTLVNTSPELAAGTTTKRQVVIALHCQIIQPLCMPPFTFSSSLFPDAAPAAAPPTALRVVELGMSALGALGSGTGSWRVVRSKGGRAWYVDTASAWVADGARATLRRDLTPEHPLRRELERLADANGNVSSGVGWHARKMEVLHGLGMLGREDGLYGAVSFAYQG